MKKNIFSLSLFLVSVLCKAEGFYNGSHREAVHQYVQKNVMPVMAEKRSAFNASLTLKEQQELAACREQLNQLFESRRQAMETKKVSTQSKEEEAATQERRETHRKIHDIMLKVEAIADNHTNELNKIFSAIAPMKEKWIEDISKIFSENQPEPEHPSGFGRSPFFRVWSRNGFLLLNSSSPVAERTASADNLLPLSISIYPNPASEEFTLNLSGVEANNKLVISDMTGKVIKEETNALPVESFSSAELPNGIYFIQITSGDQIINKKLIVNHN